MAKMTSQIRKSRPALPISALGWPDTPAPLASRTQHTQPNGRTFITLLAAFRATGGMAPGEFMAGLLAEGPAGQAADLATLINTRQAFGFEWRSSLWVPMFQFDADDFTLKAGVQDVRSALPSAYSGWRVAVWFAEPTVLLDAAQHLHSTDEAHTPDEKPWLRRGLLTAPRSPRLERSQSYDLPR